jgi:outer membrane receptor protein involved in Fe transport
MRTYDLRLAALSAAVIGCLPFGASAQDALEEIVVTATRRETDLQQTPLSIQAFTAEQLELGGITNGRDLGIMVPNVVLNPSTGGAQSQFYVRGLPGVGLYVDGIWQDGFGFQQMNFSEFERVEVLRGPQGTLFGRNTNGGAVNMTTRKPADEFGARVKLDVGDFNRRDAQLAVDLPLTDNLKTKFMGASFKNDGFLEGLTTPWDFGAQDDQLLRADVLWEATDSFSLRFTYNDEQKRGTDPRIHRMTRYDGSRVYAYNIMLGAFQAEANAACAADPARCQAIGATGNAIPVITTNQTTGQRIQTTNQSANFAGPGGTSWLPPPNIGVGTRYTGQAPTEYTPATHTTNYPENFHNPLHSDYRSPYIADRDFGPGQVGKWETKSDSMEDGITADLEYATITADWDITDNLNFLALLSQWNQDQRQVIDFDGTEFLVTTDDLQQHRENQTIELHLAGTAWNERINWIAGYYSLDESLDFRNVRWGMWEWAVPGGRTVINGSSTQPDLNVAAAEYVRQTAILLGLEGQIQPGSNPPAFSGGGMQTAATAYAGGGSPAIPLGGGAPFTPPNRYPWLFANISSDALTNAWDEDEAFFGEATVGVTEKLDLTFGVRISDKTGGDITYQPTDAFRTIDPAVRPQGDPFAGVVVRELFDPDTPNIDTYKFSAAYQFSPEMMAYITYAEGFTSAGEPVVTIGQIAVDPPGCARINLTQARCKLPAEIVANTEIGLRSDWLEGRLRFNATYFDADWDGMRVTMLPVDSLGNTQPFPYNSGEGAGTANGWEFEVIWAATERLTLNAGLGLIDTNYIQAGVFNGVTGNYPGAPFAYAADQSGTLGVQYDIPMRNGGHILLVGNAGYTGEYARDAAYQRTQIDPVTLRPILEPSYTILNTRFVYEPSARNYSVEIWGKNLLDELYVNGGFDTRDTWGYDFSIVGRSREVGVGLSFQF